MNIVWQGKESEAVQSIGRQHTKNNIQSPKQMNTIRLYVLRHKKEDVCESYNVYALMATKCWKAAALIDTATQKVKMKTQMRVN